MMYMYEGERGTHSTTLSKHNSILQHFPSRWILLQLSFGTSGLSGNPNPSGPSGLSGARSLPFPSASLRPLRPPLSPCQLTR